MISLLRHARFRTLAFLILALAAVAIPNASAVLRIEGKVMTETEENYKNYIKYLVVAPDKQGDPAFSGNDVGAIRALENKVGREIYDNMHAATDDYRFPSVVDAQEHWNVRLEVIKVMGQMRTGAVDYDYHNPNATPPIPISVASPDWQLGNPTRFYFVVKAGKPSHAAINSMLATKTRGECLGALEVCVLGGAARILGQPLFDTYHSDGSLKIDKSTSVASAFKHMCKAADPPIAIPGDLVYMRNKPDYREKARANGVATPFWSGENTVYVGLGKYSGLGLYDRSETQLRDDLAAGYLRDTGVAVPLPLKDYIQLLTPFRIKTGT